MTNVYRREVVKRTAQYVVPAAAPSGACCNEMALAIHQATQELRQHGLCPPDREPADDQIRLHITDEEILVTISLPAPASQEGGKPRG